MALDSMLKDVVVVGMGVVGGSVARAARESLPNARIFAIDRDETTLGRASEELAVRPLEGLSDLPQAALGVSVVIVALHLEDTIRFLSNERLWMRARLAMDVSSLKAPVLSAARRAGGGSFVGAHPMAGSHASGYSASRADLFEDAEVYLCPKDEAGGALMRASRFWRALGARPRRIAPEAHDMRMARASHVPQLAASALATLFESEGLSPSQLGSGGRDMVRLAASSPEMWSPLLLRMAGEDARLLRAFARRMEGIASLLEDGKAGPIRKWLQSGRSWRSG